MRSVVIEKQIEENIFPSRLGTFLQRHGRVRTLSMKVNSANLNYCSFCLISRYSVILIEDELIPDGAIINLQIAEPKTRVLDRKSVV